MSGNNDGGIVEELNGFYSLGICSPFTSEF